MPRKSDKQWYVGLANGFWSDPRLSLTEKALVAVLATWASRDMRCCPTIPQICERAGISAKPLYYHLKRLEQKGFIIAREWRDSKKRTRKLFTLRAACRIYMQGYGPTDMYIRHDEFKEDAPPNVTPFPAPVIEPNQESAGQP